VNRSSKRSRGQTVFAVIALLIVLSMIFGTVLSILEGLRPPAPAATPTRVAPTPSQTPTRAAPTATQASTQTPLPSPTLR
jgi:hypothetical protein